MVGTAPFDVSRLLRAPDAAEREAAWEQLITRHTRLLMSVARSFGGDYDDAMERYSYIVEKLRELDFRRIRTFDPEAGASFSTWLTVTARNLCLDQHRVRYGRLRAEHRTDDSTSLRAVRRALNELTENDVPTETLEDLQSTPADEITIRGELDDHLRCALRNLSARERLLLTLRFIDDMSAARIAGLLGIATPFHVYRQLNAILTKLRQALQNNGIEASDG